VLFAIIGDSGTGSRSQYQIGELMTKTRTVFPFEFVIMLGDNIYGSERPQDFVQKFEKPYQGLLAEKIPFYAALGNHDDPTQRYYKLFNMNGERFYTFKKGDGRSPTFITRSIRPAQGTARKWTCARASSRCS